MWNNQGTEQSYGDQGGGYMNTTNQFGSPQGGSAQKSRQRAQNIMPVTVAQVLSAQKGEDDNFVVDGIDLHQVTLVGLVRAVKETSTRLEYEIDDMTALPLLVNHFVENDDNTSEQDRVLPMRENTYVRVFGHVRSFNDKRNVTAFKILPIMDINEVTSHILETIHSHLALTKQVNNMGAVNSSMQQAGGMPMQTTSSYAGAQPDQGLTPIQRQVHTTIASCMDEQGVSIQFVSEKLRGVSKMDIKEAVEFLSTEGHIYSTVDDEHFKSTESM